ncbi:MAG: PPC domain-containing DNA-binding protein [archaeon]
MRHKKTSSGFVLRFFSGESVLEEFIAFLEEKKVFSGFFYGIGALNKAELAHFSLEEKKYLSKTFEEDLEVLSFSGNISLKQGKPFVHSHIVLGKKDFSVIGGHFVSGTVGATLEVFLQVFPEKIERKKDSKTELFLLEV